MTLRINNNIASINGQRNLINNKSMVGRSLEKLSSGLRINRAADDAAGLVISEQMRAQITGLNQAVDNSETAVAMVQTAEGSLDEVNSLLNKARELVLHAKNEGANDASQLQADQDELDNVIQSISRIGEYAQFGTKTLLDGNLDGVGATNNISYAKTGNLNQNLAAGTINFNVTTATLESRTLVSTNTGGVDSNTRVFDTAVTGVNIGSATLNSGATFSLSVTSASGNVITVNGNGAGTGASSGLSGSGIADTINADATFAASYTASFDGTGIQIDSDETVNFQTFDVSLSFARAQTTGTAEGKRHRCPAVVHGNHQPVRCNPQQRGPERHGLHAQPHQRNRFEHRDYYW
jgi:flagellin